MTNRVLWSLVTLAAHALNADESEYVRGDLEESGATATEALAAVLGLVVRRQAILWSDWRSWWTLAALIVPLSALLSIISRGIAEGTAVYFWLYINNWHWSFINTSGFWSVLAECVRDVAMAYLTLACWSWTGGFVLGRVSRRALRVNGLLFCALLLLGSLVIVAPYLDYFQAKLIKTFLPLAAGDPRHDTDVVFALTFYRVIFPLLLQTMLVLVPAIWGIRQGRQNAGGHPLLNLTIWIAVTGTVLTMLIQVPGLHLLVWISGGASLATAVAHVIRGLRPLVYWPLAYWIIAAIWRFRGRRQAAIQ